MPGGRDRERLPFCHPPSLFPHSSFFQRYRVSGRRRRNAPIFRIINDPLSNADDKRLPAWQDVCDRREKPHWQRRISTSVLVCSDHSASVAVDVLFLRLKQPIINPLIATLTPQNNKPSYSNTVIGTLAVDGWAVIIWYSEEGTGRDRSPPTPLFAVPPINGQCTNHCGFNVAIKGLTDCV